MLQMRVLWTILWLFVPLNLAGLPEASTLIEEAKSALDIQDWKRAQSLCQDFQERFPDHPQTPAMVFLLATSLFQQGHAYEAYDAFQKMGRLWPASPYQRRLPFWKGVAAMDCDLLKDAEKHLIEQERYPDEEPFFPRSLYYLGLVLEKRGQNPEPVWKRFLELSKEAKLQAQVTLKLVERKKENSELALSILDNFKPSANETSFEVCKRKVELLLKLNRNQEALQFLLVINKLYPNEQKELLILQCEAQRQKNDPKALSQTLEKLFKVVDTSAERQKIAVNQAVVLRQLASPTAEKKALEVASGGPDIALAWQAAQNRAFLSQKSPQEAIQFLQNWSRLSIAKNHAEEALRLALVLAENLPASFSLPILQSLLHDSSSSHRPEYLLRQGRLFLDSGDLENSLANFQEIIKQYPNSPYFNEARYQKALTYLKRKEPLRAERLFHVLIKELKQGELYQRALLASCLCFYNAGRLAQAREGLNRLIAEAPNGQWVAQTWFALGRIELHEKNYPQAASAFGQAKESFTKPEDYQQALLGQAEAFVSQEKWNQAEEVFALYAKKFPQSSTISQVRLKQGWTLFRQQKLPAALEVWQTALRQFPNDPDLREAESEAYLRLGRSQDAWKALSKATQGMDSETAGGFWYRFGLIASEIGQPSWAIKAFDMIVQKHATSTWVEQALPRSAWALLAENNPQKALKNYEQFFTRFGQRSSSAMVARSACSSLTHRPDWLDKLVEKSQTWNLAAEVRTEFQLAFLASHIDQNPKQCLEKLQNLSKTATWASQRSQAFLIAGEWALRQNLLDEASDYLKSAASIGDALSVFRGKLALSHLDEKQGHAEAAAQRLEAAEYQTGSEVPQEFKRKALENALQLWIKKGRKEDAKRVRSRLQEQYASRAPSF